MSSPPGVDDVHGTPPSGEAPGSRSMPSMITSPPLPPGLVAHRLADRLDLVDEVHRLGAEVWPEFMRHSAGGGEYYGHLHDTFADCAIVVTDGGGQVVARVLWIPFPFDGWLADEGWDWVIERGIAARRNGTACSAASALEIGIHPNLRGGGLSGILLGHMRAAVAADGHHSLFAPVRPNAKHTHPHDDMATYLRRLRPDGLPGDPWLRVHVRAGGQVVAPCNRSMTIGGTVQEWAEWTEADLAAPGNHEVPLALAPVTSDGIRAVYIEPNVWVRHPLG